MKSIKKLYKSIILIAAVAITTQVADAQVTNKGYVDIDWQFNIPINTGFADVAAGWGMGAEGGYYITDNWGIGMFINYSTNNEYIPKTTLDIGDYTQLTTDQQHSLFQLPFGMSVRYRFVPEAIVNPYVAAKIGTSYSNTKTYYNTFSTEDDSWGFYVSPEIGTTIYFTSANIVGVHIALYYNYSTNKSQVLSYDINGISNAGFRLGMSF